MGLPKFEYLEPKSLKEATQALMSTSRAVLLAGGTDLLVNMKHRVVEPDLVIDLKAISKLDGISFGKEGLRIGACTSLHDLASFPAVRKFYPALSQAAGEVGAYSHQVMGTLGGNLCQGNRCRFYNQSVFWRSVRPICYKAGGKICHVVRKPGECHSTYCGDLAPVLIAMEARIALIGPEGEGIVPLRKLYTGDGKSPLSLKRGEILREVMVPPPTGKTIYLKWRLREAIEFPTVGLALSLQLDGKEWVKKARIVFTAVEPAPVEAREAEKALQGNSLAQIPTDKIGAQAAKEISPMRTSTVSPAYKRKMAGILLKEAIEKIG